MMRFQGYLMPNRQPATHKAPVAGGPVSFKNLTLDVLKNEFK